MESGIDVAIWRYTLLSIRPETGDSMFTWGELGMKTNSELLANFGNFINRVLKFLKVKFNSVVPEAKLTDSDKSAIAELNELLAAYLQSMEAVKIRQALKTLMDISSRANQYLQDNKLANSLFESDRVRCGTIMAVACNMIYLLSALCYPFMPSISERICKQLNVPQRHIPDRLEIELLGGHQIGTPDHLFKRLEEKELNQLFLKYGGEKILRKRTEEAAAKAKAPINSKMEASKTVLSEVPKK
jgi:methionyl-tRNA synthetase